MKACQEDGGGRGAQESRRNGAVVHPRAQSGQRRGRGGREFGSARTQRRCAGVVAAGGVARGEMGEDSLDDLGSLDARDDPQRAAAHPTVFDVDAEDALEALHPAHGRTTRRMGLAGDWMGGVGDDTATVFAVRGEHAVVSGEMGAGAWHEGGEAGDEVDGVEYDMSGPVTERVGVASGVTVMHMGRAVPAARLVHCEPRSGQRMIGVVDAFDGGDGVEPGALQGRDERRLELGPGVEHRRGEHVAGDSSDGIELDVHGDIVSRARA